MVPSATKEPSAAEVPTVRFTVVDKAVGTFMEMVMVMAMASTTDDGQDLYTFFSRINNLGLNFFLWRWTVDGTWLRNRWRWPRQLTIMTYQCRTIDRVFKVNKELWHRIDDGDCDGDGQISRIKNDFNLPYHLS